MNKKQAARACRKLEQEAVEAKGWSESGRLSPVESQKAATQGLVSALTSMGMAMNHDVEGFRPQDRRDFKRRAVKDYKPAEGHTRKERLTEEEGKRLGLMDLETTEAAFGEAQRERAGKSTSTRLTFYGERVAVYNVAGCRPPGARDG